MASVVVMCLQGVYNQRRPCDDGGGAKGGDGRDEREATRKKLRKYKDRVYFINLVARPISI